MKRFYIFKRNSCCKKYYSKKPTKFLYKYVYNVPTKENIVINKHKILDRTSFISEKSSNSVDSDGNYQKVKINFGITNRYNNSYEHDEQHLINKHIKNGTNIKFDCTSGLHKKTYAVPENYVVKEKKINSSNVDKQNAIEHLKVHINKPLLNIQTGKPVILLNENYEYEEDFTEPII